MTTMSIGGATVALVESRRGSMELEAYPSRLAMVLSVINSGTFGGGIMYGCVEHKAALIELEAQIKEVRAAIAKQEEREALFAIPAPCKHCGAMTREEADQRCNRASDCHGSVLWSED